VRLAAPEVRLELDDGVPAGPSEAPDTPDEEPSEAGGQVRAAEELGRVSVLVGSLAEVDLPQVGGELGLLVLPARDVLVRADDLAPGLEVSGCLALDGRAGGPTLLGTELLLEADAEELHLHLVDVVRLWCRDRNEHAAGGIERAVRVIARESLLVRPLGPRRAELAHVRALGLAERPAEDVVPAIPHQGEESGRIPLVERLVGVQPVPVQVPLGLLQRRVPVEVAELALDEGTKPVLEQVESLADPLVVRDRHGLRLPEELALDGSVGRRSGGEADRFGPALHEAVVPTCFLGPLLALAEHV
jgi:hypothetical protein